MLLGSIFERFVEKSPLRVMARGVMEYALDSERLNRLFEEAADQPSTRKLLFSSLVDLMSLVVCGARPSLRAAYRDLEEPLPVSLTSVYNKLENLEPGVSAALLRHTANQLTPVLTELGGQRAEGLPG